jgi:beta-glucosidase
VKISPTGKRFIYFFLIAAALTISLFLVGMFLLRSSEEPSSVPENALYKDPNQPIEARVADLLSYMTLEEKIGQMTLVERKSLLDQSHIEQYHIGALLSGSGSKPEINTVEGWKNMIDGYQRVATGSRLGIPLLYGVDAIHGHAHVPGATVFPHEIGLGATHNPELVRKIGEATANELLVTGVNWNMAPNLDIPRDIRWGRTYEAFSDDPELVSSLGVAYVEGLQGKGESIRALATLKHFVGMGSMGWGTSLNKDFKIDQGVSEANEETLYAVYLPPYKDAIDAGALSIMVGLNTWGDQKMVLQKHLLTDVLKQELGFKGFLVSDWYGVHEGRKNIFGATVSSVNAGVDLVMLPFDYKTFFWHMKIANRLGLVSDERINDAVSRVLYAKFALGLFDEAERESPEVSFSEHRAWAREAVAESLVLLKNEDALLPIGPSIKHIRVAGSAADNVGMQMGAWSLEWQGVDGNWPLGTVSLLAGIRERTPAGVNVEYDLHGTFSSSTKPAEIGIAIVGEKPYAEGWGDREYPSLSREDVEAIKKLKEASKKVIVIIISGRPLLIEHEVESFDALVAAWLPGSEGGGVADVLFGHKPFTGTLPMPWPLRSEQLPIDVSGTTAEGSEVLFPRDFGLTQ